MAPSVVLVPGMFSIGPVFYPPLKQALEVLGYSDVVVVELPSVDCIDRLETVPNPLLDDIAHVSQIIKKLVDAGKDVIVVAHSYGGTVGLHATEGLWKHSRHSTGQEGGVLKVALLSSSLSLPGEAVGIVRNQWLAENDPEALKAQEAASIEMVGDVGIVNPVGMEIAFFGDMSPEDQKEWGAKGLRKTPLGVVMNEAPKSTIADWRAAYLITAEQDLSMPVKFQQWLIDHAKEKGVAIDPVKTLKSGHFVQVTHKKEVAEWIKQIAS